MTYTVLPNQTIHDVAIMSTGTLENLFTIAAANGLSVSDAVMPGVTLLIPAGVAIETSVLAQLKAAGVVVATNGNILIADADRLHNDTFNDSFN